MLNLYILPICFRAKSSWWSKCFQTLQINVRNSKKRLFSTLSSATPCCIITENVTLKENAKCDLRFLSTQLRFLQRSRKKVTRNYCSKRSLLDCPTFRRDFREIQKVNSHETKKSFKVSRLTAHILDGGCDVRGFFLVFFVLWCLRLSERKWKICCAKLTKKHHHRDRENPKSFFTSISLSLSFPLSLSL